MRILLSLSVLTALALSAVGADNPRPTKTKALIVDGQNNHTWQKTTPILKAALESSGLFTVDVATSPPQGQKMDAFRPEFARYGVVVSNYNGDEWPAATKKAFEEFVGKGGGFVCVHAADNSFPKWAEYNRMIGVGGWGGRNDNFGPMLRWRDGQVAEGYQGRRRHPRQVLLLRRRDPRHRTPHHPAACPPKWLHTPDELYATLCGPAENVTVLATAQVRRDEAERADADGHLLRQGPGLPHHAGSRRGLDEGRRLRDDPQPRRRMGGDGPGDPEAAGRLPHRRQSEPLGAAGQQVRTGWQAAGSAGHERLPRLAGAQFATTPYPD